MNVPGTLKVRVLDCGGFAGFITPVSQAPLTSVAECGAMSLFVHVIVSPTLICTTFGWYEKLMMLTARFAPSATAVKAGHVIVSATTSTASRPERFRRIR